MRNVNTPVVDLSVVAIEQSGLSSKGAPKYKLTPFRVKLANGKTGIAYAAVYEDSAPAVVAAPPAQPTAPIVRKGKGKGSVTVTPPAPATPAPIDPAKLAQIAAALQAAGLL